MLARVRALIGNAWGATTTIVISTAAALMAIKADPDLAPYIATVTGMFPWLPKAIAVIGLLAAGLRYFVPPPKAS